MLSQSAEYALRAVVCLAREPAVPLTTKQVAARSGVPAGYLSKILQVLGRAGLVTAQRGLGGGFQLSRPPARISAWEVVDAVAPLRRIELCPLSLPEHRQQLCTLHRRIDAALEHVERAFRGTRIDELLAVPEHCRPLGANRPRRRARGERTPKRDRRGRRRS